MLRFADEGGGTANPTGDAPNESAGEGTTPEEVAAVMRNAGVDLPAEPTATDEEEGIEPDEPATPVANDAAEEDAAAEGKETEEVANEEPVKPETPATPVDTAADADKYSFTVEDAEGKTFKISADDSMETVLKDFELKSNGQALDILDKLREVREQKATDEKTAAEQASADEQAQKVTDIRQSWDNEIKDLQAQDRIPTGDDAEARTEEVFKFMGEENDKRVKSGKPLLNSFEDALDKLENKEARDKAASDAKAAKDTARKNGSLVGGSSAPATSGTPVYQAGSARNSNEAIRALGLLN